MIKFIDLIKTFLKFTKKVFINTYKNDLSGVSAEIAFYMVFSLFPIMISLIAILSFFARDPNFYLNLTSFLYSSVSPELANLINTNLKTIINSLFSTSVLIISIMIALWTSSNVITSFIKGIDRAYDVKETRSFITIQRLSISLVFSIGFLLIVAFTLIVFGENLFEWYLKVDYIILPKDILSRLEIARWSFVSIILFLLSSLLYFKAPNVKHKIIEVLPGAIFFSLTWSLSTILFGIYLNNFSTYNITYGTLATVIILLLWFFITAFIFLLGAEINATLYPYSNQKIILQIKEYIKQSLKKKKRRL